MDVTERADRFRRIFEELREEVGKVIVGHREAVEQVLTAVFCGGNVLLEGVPGLGKTMLVRTLAAALELRFSRVQFTPDLMPADIVGTTIIVEDEAGRREFRFQEGPLFANIVLADEINRATPKTQSALLEAMQEHSVTVGRKTYRLDDPFFVLATQNPLEMEGTYPLPEAQVDRFFFKVLMKYSSREELGAILARTTAGHEPEVKPLLGPGELREWREFITRVVIAPHVQDYAVRLALGTHPGGEFAGATVNRFVRYGASPRGAQAMVMAGKVAALLDGRLNVSFDDLAAAAVPALRHRIIRNFEGEAESVEPDAIVRDVVAGAAREIGVK
ncbi:MAG: MoxR family ATPase [Planctomycetes bacterium]|nr:MoxR family ATPase [Planctomycetota bacterium]